MLDGWSWSICWIFCWGQHGRVGLRPIEILTSTFCCVLSNTQVSKSTSLHDVTCCFRLGTGGAHLKRGYGGQRPSKPRCDRILLEVVQLRVLKRDLWEISMQERGLVGFEAQTCCSKTKSWSTGQPGCDIQMHVFPSCQRPLRLLLTASSTNRHFLSGDAHISTNHPQRISETCDSRAKCAVKSGLSGSHPPMYT